jgi:alanine racemase
MLSSFRRIKNKLSGDGYRTLNKIEISKANLLFNYRYLRTINHRVQVAPVLKSNAYGHGLSEIVSILDPEKPPMYCVDSLPEAVQIRNISRAKVLIMGYIDPLSLSSKKYDFSYTIFNLHLAKAVSKYQPGSEVHVFVDTGMHREGVPLKELPEFLTELKKLPNIKIVGIMSHFASADEPKSPQTAAQAKEFQRALEIAAEHGIQPIWKHLAASSGLVAGHSFNTNLARVGKALYGIDPLTWNNPKLSASPLKPTLELYSQIIETKQLSYGEKVGYNGAFRATGKTTIGILPIGYYDGVERRLTNAGTVIIGGTPCPIIGKVSMNITTVDISKVSKTHIGQKVQVISNNPTDPNSIASIARTSKTIPHEIMIHLSPTNLRRIIV